jgi:hypothetical protein
LGVATLYQPCPALSNCLCHLSYQGQDAIAEGVHHLPVKRQLEMDIDDN